MTLWIVLTINSIALGGLLFLLSAGFSLIFGLMRIPNLTHGALFMLGAYFGVTFLRLVERDFPGHGIVEGATFRMAWLTNQQRDTTWWVPPGAYTLQRRDQADKVVEQHAVRVEAGRVIRFEETEAGLRRRE